MPTTEANMVTAIKAKLEAKSRDIPTGQSYDSESGAQETTTSTVNMEWTDDTKLLVEAIVEGLYEKIRTEGLEMGPSTSTTMDVG